MGSATSDHNISFEELCEVVAPIAEKHGVDRVYLFGSRARGDNDTESDFDFYIEPGRVETLIKLCGLLRDLQEVLGENIDLVSEDPYLKEEFKKEVFRDRKLIYES
jgi:Predicted nucleotidyltransferases